MKLYASSGQNARCTMSLGSVTAAMKARRILSSRSITCDVIKISSKSDERGCVYGIEYPCELSMTVKALLSGVISQAR